MGGVRRGGVYVCFDRADRGYVARLVRYLLSVGLPYWYYDEGSADDAGWTARIQTSDVVVVVMSDASFASDRVAAEIAQAREQRKPIMPLLVSGSPFISLASLTYEDVTRGNLPSRRFLQGLATRVGGPAPPRRAALLPILLGAGAAWNGIMALWFWSYTTALWTFVASSGVAVLAGCLAVAAQARWAQRLCLLSGLVGIGTLVVALGRHLFGDDPPGGWIPLILAVLGALGTVVYITVLANVAERRMVRS